MSKKLLRINTKILFPYINVKKLTKPMGISPKHGAKVASLT